MINLCSRNQITTTVTDILLLLSGADWLEGVSDKEGVEKIDAKKYSAQACNVPYGFFANNDVAKIAICSMNKCGQRALLILSCYYAQSAMTPSFGNAIEAD